jgi:hypothetical protein
MGYKPLRHSPARRSERYEREQRRAEDEYREWEKFKAKLRSAKSFADAISIVQHGPQPGAPGRRFYSNLGSLLKEFAPPAYADSDEVREYVDVLDRINADASPPLKTLLDALRKRTSQGLNKRDADQF